MQNPVYSLVSEALARMVSERAADTMLRAAFRDVSIAPERVTPEEMQRVLAGPLERRLSTLMPPARARQELRSLASHLQSIYPKAPTLFRDGGEAPARETERRAVAPAPAPVPGPVSSGPLGAYGGDALDIENEEFDIDDFEFDDPDDGPRVTITPRLYDLSSSAGQDALLLDLARFDGVQGVVLCDESGRVVRSRAARGADTLGTVMVTTVRLLGGRPWRIMCADLGTQAVYVRPLGRHLVALLTASNTNVGRLFGELSAIKESA